MRLLLRSGANPGLENKNGKTPISIAKERGHELCEELLMHALQRKKIMFENVNIDWHISQDDGSTDFSDDETLDDPSTATSSRLNGSRTPEKSTNISPNKHMRSGQRPVSTLVSLASVPPMVLSPNNNNNNNSKSDWTLDRTPISDWSRSTPSDSTSGGSPGSYRIMPPPPPPQSKKPVTFSGSNLPGHTLGSLKKGLKPMSSISLPTTSYNTLPINHNVKHSSSPRHAGGCPPMSSLSLLGNKPIHKRSPSTDSGTGSNTPISSYHSNNGSKQGHHTVYLHGSKSSGSSDTSPPMHMQSFAEESSPENRVSPSPPMTSRILNGRSTESLDSFSDESGGHQHAVRQISGGRRDRSSRSYKNPVPPPRKSKDFTRERLCRALYDCEADNDDELTFEEGDTIVIVNEETEDENWMEGHLLSDPSKRGLFPVSFVHIISD